MGDCCEVPLVEKLRSVPKNYRVVEAFQWASDGTETGHSFIPIGYMMHEAADEIERLRIAFRANMLRYAPALSHGDIDRVLFNNIDTLNGACVCKNPDGTALMKCDECPR